MNNGKVAVDISYARAFARYGVALALRRPQPHLRDRSTMFIRFLHRYFHWCFKFETSWRLNNLPLSAQTLKGLLADDPLDAALFGTQTSALVFLQPLRDGKELRVFVWKALSAQVPTFAIQLGRPLKFNKSLVKAVRRAQELGLRAAGDSLVIYSSLKLGITCRTRTQETVIVDLSDFSVTGTFEDLAPPINPTISEALVDRVESDYRMEAPSDTDINLLLDDKNAASPYQASRCLAVSLVTQCRGGWCAGACACMVLSFFGLPYRDRQAEVVGLMDPCLNGKFGISEQKQLAGLKTILATSRPQVTPILYVPIFDDSARKYVNLGWDELKALIDSDHPIMWNTVVHCMVVTGYGQANWPNGQSLQVLWVSDPSGFEAQYLWSDVEYRGEMHALVTFH
jgi:hypothetical protein